MTDEDRQQGRLQEYGITVAPPPADDAPPMCERCGCELDESEADRWRPVSQQEGMTEVVDLARGNRCRNLCTDCRNLERYLAGRHAQLSNKPGVTGAVAVFCECQSRDEVDVQPVRRGERGTDRACSRCGSTEVVLEELPPESPHPGTGGVPQ